jgi:hypothetical protein
LPLPFLHASVPCFVWLFSLLSLTVKLMKLEQLNTKYIFFYIKVKLQLFFKNKFRATLLEITIILFATSIVVE